MIEPGMGLEDLMPEDIMPLLNSRGVGIQKAVSNHFKPEIFFKYQRAKAPGFRNKLKMIKREV